MSKESFRREEIPGKREVSRQEWMDAIAFYKEKRASLIIAAAISRDNAISHRNPPFKVGCAVMGIPLSAENSGEYEIHQAYNFKPEPGKKEGNEKRCAERNALDAAKGRCATIAAIVTTSKEIHTGDLTKAHDALHPCQDCRNMLRQLLSEGFVREDTMICGVNDSEGGVKIEERTLKELLDMYDDAEEGSELEFWSGPDIKINRDIIVRPNEIFDLHLDLKDTDWPREKLENSEILGERLFTSTRSALAQLGLEITYNLPAFEEIIMGRTKNSEKIELPFRINNFGYRPIELRNGDPIFRFFSRSKKEKLQGINLANYVFDNKILEGKYGKDWWFVDKNGKKIQDGEKLDGAFLICLAFDPKKRLWVPPSDKPIRVTERDKIEEILEPIPPEIKNPDFFITEARANLRMAGRPGILRTEFMPGSYKKTPDYRQTRSVLIDPKFGNTYHKDKKVRLEIINPETNIPHDPWVYMEVW